MVQTDREEFEPIHAEAVEALSDSMMGLLCKVGDRRLPIPHRFLLEGSEVRKPGDRGTLVIPAWLAKTLGVVSR